MPKDVQISKVVPDWDPPMNLPGYRPYRGAEPQGAATRVVDDDPHEQEADHLRRRRHHRTPGRPRS